MGHRTISQFLAFRSGYNQEEMAAGLQQTMSPTKVAASFDHDRYHGARAKVFTNRVAKMDTPLEVENLRKHI